MIFCKVDSILLSGGSAAALLCSRSMFLVFTRAFMVFRIGSGHKLVNSSVLESHRLN